MADPTDTPETAKKPRHRSPNYPTVGLRDAVIRVTNLIGKDGKAGAPPEIAAVHIGFGKPHGQAMSTLAALKRFGLIAESNGRVVPTQRAVEIVHLPEGDSRRLKAIRDAVMEPPIYRELIEQHRESGWPADEVLASELIAYKNFNPNAAGGFVTDLKDSLEYAGLSSSIPLEYEIEDEEESSMAETQAPPAALTRNQPRPTPVDRTDAKHQKTTREGLMGQISTPVGRDDGQVVFAHVTFDGEIRKEFVTSLKAYLTYLETTLN